MDRGRTYWRMLWSDPVKSTTQWVLWQILQRPKGQDWWETIWSTSSLDRLTSAPRLCSQEQGLQILSSGQRISCGPRMTPGCCAWVCWSLSNIWNSKYRSLIIMKFVLRSLNQESTAQRVSIKYKKISCKSESITLSLDRWSKTHYITLQNISSNWEICI